MSVLTAEQRDNMHQGKYAIPGRIYTDYLGHTYIGTEESRLRLIPAASEIQVPPGSGVPSTVTNIYQAITNIYNLISIISSSESTEQDIVAKAAGTQANARLLTKTYNIIKTVVTTNDACLMPAAVVSKRMEVFNQHTNDMRLYPAVGERFMFGTTLMPVNNPFVVGGENGYRLICYTPKVWRIA